MSLGSSNSQHKELGSARVERDNNDFLEILAWFGNMKGSYKFSFSLKTVTINWKRFGNLSHQPIYDLLCLLSYWESINSHS